MRSPAGRSRWKPEPASPICRSDWSMPIWQSPGTRRQPADFYKSKGSQMDLGLKDCRAFVAGASRGLGLACAKALADEGARVFICSRNTQELKRAAAQSGAAGYSAADVSRPADVARVVAEAIAALG